jgi:hypothetical protein
MMHRRSLQAIHAFLLAAASMAAPIFCAAQAASAGSRAPGASVLDIYGGYAYFRPHRSSLDGYGYGRIDLGALSSVADYFNAHYGVQIEGQFSPHGPNDCFYTAQAGPIYKTQFGRLTPFAHLLGGAVRLGGPVIQPCTWGWGATGGMGLDYVLPGHLLRNRLAARLVQGDFEYSDVSFGPNTAPTYLNGGNAKLKAFRLSTGIVLRLGERLPDHPAQLGCEAQPVSVYPGDPVMVTGKTIYLDDNKKLKPLYHWTSTGGKISGNTETATVSTAGLVPGDYTVTGRVSEGTGPNQHAECSASFRVNGYKPPTISCAANPSTIMPGGSSTITAEATSPQNRAINFSYGATAGQITGVGPTGSLSAADVSAGVITISCNVVDDLGQSASASTTVTVVTPPPPPAPPPPAARSLCSVSFERDRKRPVRVDNEAKGCLDDIALELNRDADAILVVVGKHDPQEKPEAAAQRTLNVKQYMSLEKGIDPTRIELRTGESTGRSADDILVPPGATWDPGGTTSFDPARVPRSGEPYAAPRR